MIRKRPEESGAALDDAARRRQAEYCAMIAGGLAKKAAGQAAGEPVARKAKRQADPGQAGRWATLNAFHDTVARHLTPAEQAVWGHLFRWCREGKVSASARGIATACGIDKETASLAISKLKAVGLVWAVSISRHKGTASVYGMHPHPDRCLQRCIDAGRPSRPK
jgi:hypothetical protein